MTTDEAFVRLEEVDAEAEEDDGAGAADDDEAVDEAAAGVGAAAGAAATGAGISRTREYSADTLARSLIRMLRGARQAPKSSTIKGRNVRWVDRSRKKYNKPRIRKKTPKRRTRGSTENSQQRRKIKTWNCGHSRRRAAQRIMVRREI
jgi:hypothetical protein